MFKFTFTFGKCKKVDYKSEKTAKLACLEMAKKGSADLEPYQCDLCGGWHIGHRLPLKRRD
jgi:hypothetical protein